MTDIPATLEPLFVELHRRLAGAAVDARLALDDIRDGERNRAIGAILPAQDHVAVAAALIDTILTLHRARHVGEGGGR